MSTVEVDRGAPTDRLPATAHGRGTGDRYRVLFALIVIAGNRSRTVALRPIIDRDPTLAARWTTMRTYEDDVRMTWAPAVLRPRLRNLANLLPLVFSSSDAAVINAYESYVHYGFVHWLLRRRCVVVNFYDGTYTHDGDFGSGLPEASSIVSRWLRKITLDRTSLFVPWSQFTAARSARAYPPAAGRTMVLHPGVDLDRWPMRERHEGERRLRLLFVGGDGLRKGLDTLIDAYIEGPGEHCDLDVVTSVALLPDELRHRIDELPGVRIHDGLTSGSPALRALFEAADVFVLPTRMDLSSIASIEAMATGVPVITTDVGGLPDIVVDGVTGLVVTPGDAAGLATRIELLRGDPRLRQRLAEAGRAHVEAHFDSRKNGPALLQAVKELVDDERRRRTPRRWRGRLARRREEAT